MTSLNQRTCLLCLVETCSIQNQHMCLTSYRMPHWKKGNQSTFLKAGNQASRSFVVKMLWCFLQQTHNLNNTQCSMHNVSNKRDIALNMQDSNAARREQEGQQYHPKLISSKRTSKQPFAKHLAGNMIINSGMTTVALLIQVQGGAGGVVEMETDNAQSLELHYQLNQTPSHNWGVLSMAGCRRQWVSLTLQKHSS